MLDIYEQLFKQFDRASIRYSVFKSLEHLAEDLAGDRGDLDIWFDANSQSKALDIALECGFFKVKWSKSKFAAFILVGWDMKTGKKVLLHIHHWPIGVKKRSFLPLYFTYNLPPLPATVALPKQPTEDWVNKFESEKRELKRSGNLKLVGKIISHPRNVADLNFRFSLKETLRIYPTYFRRFVLDSGRYMIRRKGLIIAFVGVDGSGKSSIVENLSKSDFINTTQGHKVVYFGNKDFWIPGLMRAKQRIKKNKPLIIFLTAMSFIDIRLRLIPALFARWRGKIVLCDRYFYDQLVGDPTGKFIKKQALKKLVRPAVEWLPIKPNATFYIQVDPKNAYKRKRDYSYEKVKTMAAAYDSLLPGRPEVTVIDANQPLDKVLYDIRHSLNEALKTGRVK